VAQENLKSAAMQAGLNASQQAQIDGLSKLLSSHKTLMALPSNVAQQKFNTLPQDQRNAHVALLGGDQPTTQNRSMLGDIGHYVGQAIKTGLGAPFKALNEVSDFMTRLYRTGAIAIDQGVNLGDAFTIANDKGDKVFMPDRIQDATKKYGSNYVNVAMKVAAGESMADIFAKATDAEKEIIAANVKNKDPLFNEVLGKVQAAKYSPGRQIANLLLPESLEGTSGLYTGISGTFDTAYRVFADPTLALGKAKKVYDAANYAVFKIAGSPQALDKAFTKKGVVDFFNSYGATLTKLDAARKSDNLIEAEQASRELRRIAPEFGPATADVFIQAGVKDAATARNFLQNHSDVATVLAGQAARKTPLIPRLDLARKTRINFFTATDKVFNIDNVGQKLVHALYGTGPAYQDITEGLVSGAEKIASLEKQVGKLNSASVREPLSYLQGKIDRFARKFTTIPYFKNGFFDVAAPDAATQIYRMSRLTNTRYHSRVIAEAFSAGDEGQKKQIFTGLWNTIGEIRGVSHSIPGMSYLDEFAGKGLEKKYAPSIVTKQFDDAGVELAPKVENPAEFDGQQMALFPYQLSSGIAAPSISDLDRLAARSGIIDRIVGVSHSRWADKMTSGWVLGTLAGPRFPVRNAAEDLMMHLAVGDSPWGLVKARFLSTKLRASVGEGNLGFINKLVRRKDTVKYQQMMKEAVASGDVNAARTVMAQAVLDSKLVGKLDKRGQEYLAEIARYGNLDDTLREVGEGGMNALRGGDQYVNATNDVARFGQMGAITINDVEYRQVYGRDVYAEFNPVANEQSRISWLVQLGITANDDLAKIAVMNLNDREAAIIAMRNYLDNLSPVERGRFSLYSTPGATTQIHAERAYDAVKTLFSKRNGDINDELLSKVRYLDNNGDMVVSSRNLHLEDLPDRMRPDLSPEWISGPTLVPVSEGDNFISSIMDKTWEAMGEANARFSREPIVIHTMIQIRKDMADSGFEESIFKRFTAGLTGEEAKMAAVQARRHIVGITEDLAKERVLAYVDNPAVRSQLAMSARNFARFYRATEDFYRRIYRTVKYNPESLTRASLTYDGVAHSGFVQTDDQGDQYFFYPGLTPVYQAMNKALKAFGVGDAFQVPMPVQFGAKLNMATPSMNPDSIFPTFSGPLAAVPMKMVFNLIPQLEGLEKSLLGKYSVDQPMINAVLPSHVNRLLGALNKDERNSQYASAYRKGVTYLEASGHGIPEKLDAEGNPIPATPQQLEDYKDKLQAATTTVLAVRFLFGFAAIASPQVTLKSDMAKWVRDNGTVSFKQAYNDLIEKYKGDMDKATADWIKYFPDQMPYTVSESDRNTVAQVRAVEQAGFWIDQNKNLLDAYPEAAAFLIPRAGTFDFGAYKLLASQGMKQNKVLTDFLRETQTAKDKEIYYNNKNDYEKTLSETYGDSAKREVNKQWLSWSEQYKKTRPLLQEELGSGAGRQIQRRKAYEDLTRMLNDKTIKTQPKTRSVLKKMVAEYASYVNTRDSISGSSNSENSYKDLIKQNTIFVLKELAATNDNAQAAYDSLFSSLIGE
jgi:hypothetical protein